MSSYFLDLKAVLLVDGSGHLNVGPEDAPQSLKSGLGRSQVPARALPGCPGGLLGHVDELFLGLRAPQAG